MYSSYLDFRACYEDALWRKPDASGRVRLRFVINESGRVEGSCVQHPMFADGGTVDCILARLNSIDFGVGERVTVIYPILLIPER